MPATPPDIPSPAPARQVAPPAHSADPADPPRGRLVVCSIPKAGTYLLGDLLASLGYRDTRLHLGVPVSQDYSGAEVDVALAKPNQFDSPIRWPRILDSVGAGEFAVSHVGAQQVNDLHDFRVAFLYRNLRDVWCAYARFVARTGRWGAQDQDWAQLPDGPDKLRGFIQHHGDKALGVILPVAGWYHRGAATKFCFEALLGDLGPELQDLQLLRLAKLTGRPAEFPTLRATLRATLETQTMTRSAKRTDWQAMWSEEAEAYFESSGLKQINTELGYEGTGLPELRRSFAAAELEVRDCPICGRRDAEVVCETDRHDLGLKTGVCRHCSACYLVEYPSTEWIGAFYRDRYWSLYDIGGIEHEAASSRQRTAKMLEAVIPADRKIASLLDIGCGTGGMLRSARERWPAVEIQGIDPSEDAVARCRGYGFDVQQVSDMTRVQLERPRTFELVTIIHVAEHLVEPVNLIGSAAELMDDDGLLYLDVPNVMSGRWNSTNFIHLAHPQMFHRESLDRLLQRCGLEAVRWTYAAAPEWPWAIGVLARKRAGGAVSADQVPAAGADRVRKVADHVRRHVNPPLPQTGWSRVRRQLARIGPLRKLALHLKG